MLVACTMDSSEFTPVPQPQLALPISASIVLNAQGVSSWWVENVSGQMVTQLDIENPEWLLRVGERYEVINLAGLRHPFELRAVNGKVLLSQNRFSAFGRDTAVNFQISEDQTVMAFTLTEALAFQLYGYHCALHPGMTGRIRIVGWANSDSSGAIGH